MPSEVMSLIAYNWPGNVREVETVVREIQVRKERDCDNDFNKTLPVLARALSNSQTGFKWDDCIKLRQSLEMNGVDVVMLEKVLNMHGLGLDNGSKKRPFSNIDDSIGFFSSDEAHHFDKRFNTITIYDYVATQRIGKGLNLYCALFMRNEMEDRSLFEVRNKKIFCFLNPLTKAFGLNPRQHGKLVLDIVHYVTGMSPIRRIPFPEGLLDYEPFIFQSFGGTIEDPYPCPQEKKEKENQSLRSVSIPTDISEDELLGIYYRKLLKETHGVQKAAAARAGLGPDCFRKRLKKMGIMRKEDS